MVGLVDNTHERERRFLASVADFRERLRDELLAVPKGSLTAARFEVDLDQLLMTCAQLAQEPVLSYMSRVMEAAVAFVPSPFTTYPAPPVGAPVTPAANPTTTPDLVNVLTRMVTHFLSSNGYRSRFPDYKGFPAGTLWYNEPGEAHAKMAFIHDVIHLVDNPKHIPPKEPRHE